MGTDGTAADGHQALETVQAIYAAVGRGDIAAAAARLSPDIVVRQSSGLPFAGNWHGRAGFTAMAAMIGEAWPGFAVSPELMLAHDDTVLVLTRVTGASGALDQPMIERWRVLRGEAVECQPFYFDTSVASSAANRET